MTTEKRSKITIVSIVFVFLLTTFLGLNIFMPKSANASGEPGVLKFKQLAAGEDFVIALSYDNELYGFSLRSDADDYACKPISTDPKTKQTLGEYYPKNPIKIDKFHGRNNDQTINNAGGALPGGDSILKIAATRTTAALITNNGYIYTWGYDAADEPSTGDGNANIKVIKGLLLNGLFTGARGQTTPDKIYEPTIINDNYINYFSNAEHKALDIVGNGDNYVAVVDKRAGAGENTKLHFTWGNSSFNQVSYPSGVSLTTADKLSIETRKLNSYSNFYVGQGFIVARSESGENDILSLQGKNFSLPIGVNYTKPTDGDVIDVGSFIKSGDNVKSGNFNLTTEKDSEDNPTNKKVYKITDAFVNQFTQLSSGTLGANGTAEFVYGDSTKLTGTQTIPSVSFGNGYGYYVTDIIKGSDGSSSGGEVYFIGNNAAKQGASDYKGNVNYNDDTKFLSKWAQISNLSTIKQIVAGNTSKGLESIGNSPFMYKGSDSGNTFDSVGEAISIISFNEEYCDGEVYISAALKDDGTVFAWNKDTTAPTKVEFDFTNGNNKIVSLTAGYNNELFALSNIGRIYRINYKTVTHEGSADTKEFVVTPIDTFSNGSNAIQPWEVNKDLSVAFVGDTETTESWNKSKNEKKAQISVKVNYNYSDSTPVDVAVVNSTEGEHDDRSFVNVHGSNFVAPESNYAQDAYRILVSNTDNEDYGLTVPAGYNGNRDAGVSSAVGTVADLPVGAIRFYSRSGSTDTELRYEVVKNFIDFEIVVDSSTSETYFLITPKKATKENNDIIVKFWIGRFDNKANQAPGNDSAKFYDCRPTELRLSIGNTTADFYSLANDKTNNNNAGYKAEGSTDEMSKIPVLDANNLYNNKYSIALMDVSTGFDKIAEGIAAAMNKSEDTETVKAIKADIIGYITEKDGGFPAKSRIGKGNLDYSMGAGMADFYYKDIYKFYASDIDGDIVQIAGTFGNEDHANKNDIRDSIDNPTIKIDIDLSKYAYLDLGTLEQFINTGDSYNEAFNNVYGFHDIKLDKEKSLLTVEYDVVTVTAKTSTGSVRYTGSTSVSVGAPEFTDDKQDPDVFSFRLQEGLKYSENKIINYFHVQSTLRMKDAYKTPDDKTVYGNPGSNVYRYTYKDGSSESITVGAEKNKNIKIDINDFFADISDNSGIKFSYDGRTGDTAFRDFERNFNPALIDVKLEADTFTFTPKEKGITEIKLTVRRFYGTANFGNSETIDIYLTVNAVTVDDDGKDSFRLKDERHPVTMNSRTQDIVPIDRFVIQDPSIAKIEDVTVTDTSVVTVSFDDNKATFTAKKSGVVNVSFTVSVYNTVLTDSFSLIVEDIAQMDNVYAVSNSKNIYTDDVKRFLRAANASSGIPDDLSLYREDETDDTQGFYFQQYLLADNGGYEWTEVPLSDLTYISSARIRKDTTGEHLRLELKSVGSQEIQNATRVVMNFRSAGTGKIYSAAAQFAPANQLIQTAEKAPYIFEIEYGKDFENQGTDTNSPSRAEGSNTVLLPLKYLTDMLPGGVDYDDAEISFVSAQNGYEEFFSLDKTITAAGHCISITPLYPTKTLENDYATVNVSIRDKAGTGYLLSFNVRISGIRIDLDKKEYGDILLIAFLCSFAFLFIIFIIRMAVYWKRKADQRRIIRKNQMLIKMRDKMHNKTTAAPREQIVKTKMKMEDPKYAKMFEQMRQKKEEETGISLENSAVAKKAKQKTKAAEKTSAKGKKGKKGKKSIEELKAELEAKKMAFAQMQMDGATSSMGGDMSDGMDVNDTPMFDNADGFADAEVQPEFDAGFVDPDSIQIDDLGDN